MDREELKAGESCCAQLRLEEETAAKKWDHFVIRFYSPEETIGGGVILDACPRKHRKNDRRAQEAFAVKEKGSQEEMLELSCREHWGNFYSLKELAQRSSLERSRVKQCAKRLADAGKIVPLLEDIYIHREELSFYQKKTEGFLEDFHKANPLKEGAKRLADAGKIVPLLEDIYIHREELSFYQKKTEGFLEDFHKANPLKEGMGVEEVRSRLNLGNVHVTDAVLEILKKEKIIKEENGLISRKRFQVVVKADEGAMIDEIVKYYLEVGFAPLTTELYIKEHKNQKKFSAVFTSLLNKKTLIRLDGQYCVHREYYQKAREAFLEMIKERPVVALGEFRDYLGCSRKIAVALLEHFDKNGFTRKTEEGRVLKASPEKGR